MSKPNLAAQPSQQSKGDLKSGTIQTQQTGSTLNIDRSNDPRFQKRIPDEFYTREEKNFEPLPSHWETGIYGGRKYFVNHKAKTTSWIDPRTKKTRKHDLDKIEPGELPYGWEEAVDRHFGVYYINHIVQANYPDPPWDPIVKQQASELQKFVDEQIRKNEEALLEIERKEQEKIDAAAKRVEELEAAKIRIEAELLQLRQQALADVDVSESETSDASSIYSVSSTVTERELEQNLQQIEKEIEEIKPSTIPKSKEEFQQRLQDLVELNKRLAAGGPGYDGVAEYKKTEEELKTVSDMLKREAESRAMLEEQILALKRDMEMLYGEEAQPKEEEEEEEEEEDEDEEPINIIQKMSQPEFQFQTKANLNRKTRYEMELELLNLKKKLVSEKLERERLARLKDQIDSTPDTGKMPGWIKQINEVAASSKTLRVKIGQKQASSPDALSFRERMLFFASGKDAASKAKIDVPKKK